MKNLIIALIFFAGCQSVSGPKTGIVTQVDYSKIEDLTIVEFNHTSFNGERYMLVWSDKQPVEYFHVFQRSANGGVEILGNHTQMIKVGLYVDFTDHIK